MAADSVSGMSVGPACHEGGIEGNATCIKAIPTADTLVHIMMHMLSKDCWEYFYPTSNSGHQALGKSGLSLEAGQSDLEACVRAHLTAD